MSIQSADTPRELDALYARRDRIERTQRLLRSFSRVCARNDDLTDTAGGLDDLASDLEAMARDISEAINMSRAAA